jgi:hypothetical protein
MADMGWRSTVSGPVYGWTDSFAMGVSSAKQGSASDGSADGLDTERRNRRRNTQRSKSGFAGVNGRANFFDEAG